MCAAAAFAPSLRSRALARALTPTRARSHTDCINLVSVAGNAPEESAPAAGEGPP